MNEFLIINKEPGCTSRDVVNQVVKKFNTKKVGHIGTLDPMATGVLVVGINKATKVFDLLKSSKKEYIAEVQLGIITDTLDTTGKILNTTDINVNDKDIDNTLKSFLGKSIQEVPKYSAVKVNGRRLYDYARNNIDVKLPKREIEVFDIELLKGISSDYTFKFRCLVSSGTYIRSLIRDIADKLNTLGVMKSLVRVKVDDFDIKDSKFIKEISNNDIIPIDKVLKYDKIVVDDKLLCSVLNGNITDRCFESEYGLFYDKQNNLIAIYGKYEKLPNKIKPYAIF